MNPAAKLNEDYLPPLVTDRLDPEAIWMLWCKEKSLAGATRKLAEVGILSPITGKPYTRQALHLAAQKAPQYDEAVKKLTKKRKYFTQIRHEKDSE